MKQIFTPIKKKDSIWTLFRLISILLIICGLFKIIGFSAGVVGVFAGILVLVLTYLYETYTPGKLTLEDGVLSRENFITLWSIKVSSITDVIEGYSFGLRMGSRSVLPSSPNRAVGLSFKTNEGKFYEFRCDVQDNLIQDGSDLISKLKEINPSIVFHFDAKPFRGYFGWRGDKRLGRMRIVIVGSILVVLIALFVMHNFLNLI